jgi:predicted SAM-dependent methyltransferase
LVFNGPAFFRWYSIRKAYEHSEVAGRFMEQDWQINDLELELEKARAS